MIVENNYGYARRPTRPRTARPRTPGVARVDIKRSGRGCRTLDEPEISPSTVPEAVARSGLIYLYTKPEGPARRLVPDGGRLLHRQDRLAPPDRDRAAVQRALRRPQHQPEGRALLGRAGRDGGDRRPVMPQQPLVFLGIVALLTITPGADMAMVARSVFTGGRRDAFATTLGISAGCLAWAGASALGVAAVLAASQTAYDTLRLVGAAYLVWLGVQSLLAARVGGYGAAAAATAAPRRTSPFRQGLLTNLLQPQDRRSSTRPSCRSSSPRATRALAVSMLLACVHIALGILWLSLYAWLLGRAVERVQGLAPAPRARRASTGTVLVRARAAAGRRAALTGRRAPAVLEPLGQEVAADHEHAAGELGEHRLDGREDARARCPPSTGSSTSIG